MILNHIGLVVLSLVVGHAAGQIILIASDRLSNWMRTANLWLILNNAFYLIFVQGLRDKITGKQHRRSASIGSFLPKSKDNTNSLIEMQSEGLKSKTMAVNLIENPTNVDVSYSMKSPTDGVSDRRGMNSDLEMSPDSGSTFKGWKTYPENASKFSSFITIIIFILGLGITRFLSVPILYGTSTVFVLPNPTSEDYRNRLYLTETGDSFINARLTNEMYPWAHFYDRNGYRLEASDRTKRINKTLSNDDIIMGLYPSEMAELLETEDILNNQSFSLLNLSTAQTLTESAFYRQNRSLIDLGFSSMVTTYNESIDTIQVPLISLPIGTYTSRIANMFISSEANLTTSTPGQNHHTILRQLLLDKEYFQIDFFDSEKKNYFKMPIYYMYFGTFDYGDISSEMAVATPYVGFFNGSVKGTTMVTEMLYAFDVNFANDSNVHVEFEDGEINGAPWLDSFHDPKMYTANDDYSYTYTNAKMKGSEFYLFKCDNNGTNMTFVYQYNPTLYEGTNITRDDVINCTETFFEDVKLPDSHGHIVPNPLFIRYTWLHEHKNITIDKELISLTSDFSSKALYFNEIYINGSQRYHLPSNSKYTDIETRYILPDGAIAIMCLIIGIWLLMLYIPTIKRTSTIIFEEEQAILANKSFLNTMFSESHATYRN